MNESTNPRSGRRYLAAALTVLIVAGASPADATAAPGLEVALQDDNVFVARVWYERERALVQAREIGVTRLRVNVPWARTVADPEGRREPDVRTYAWAPYDSLIAAAARYGIRIQMTLVGPAPAWATANRRVGVVEPDPRAFAQFAADAAEHFRGRVDRYSIWNEPNWHTWLQPAASCRKGRWSHRCDVRLGYVYRALYRHAYDAIKHVDRTARVLFGELAPLHEGSASTAPLAFLRTVTCSDRQWRESRSCVGLRADGFAHHPYAFGVDPAHGGRLGADDVTLGTLSRLTDALDKLARRGALTTPTGRPMNIYLTEFGYFQSGTRRISQVRRAAYLRESFDIALRKRRVHQLLQFLLVTPPPEADTYPTAIVAADGRPTASFEALAAWAARNATRIARPLPVPSADPPG